MTMKKVENPEKIPEKVSSPGIIMCNVKQALLKWWAELDGPFSLNWHGNYTLPKNQTINHY